MGPRAHGTIYDSYIGDPDIATYPFETLDVPTLVVAAEDDTMAPNRDTRAMTDRIPGARFVSVPRGGQPTQDPHRFHGLRPDFEGSALPIPPRRAGP